MSAASEPPPSSAPPPSGRDDDDNAAAAAADEKPTAAEAGVVNAGVDGDAIVAPVIEERAPPLDTSGGESLYSGWSSMFTSLSQQIGLTVATDDGSSAAEGGGDSGAADPGGGVPRAAHGADAKVGSDAGAAAAGGGTELFSDMFGNVVKSLQTFAVEDFGRSASETLADVTHRVQEASQNFSFDTSSLEQSASQLLGNASELVQRELFTVAPASGGGEPAAALAADAREALPPWEALPELERVHSVALRRRLLKLVHDAFYSTTRRKEIFESGAAEKASFHFDYSRDGAHARGALRSDDNLRRLRTELVPRRLHENVFWDNYFFHVERIRRDLRMGLDADDDDDDDEDGVGGVGGVGGSDGGDDAARGEGVDGVVEATGGRALNGVHGGASAKRNWDEEIDKIFGGDNGDDHVGGENGDSDDDDDVGDGNGDSDDHAVAAGADDDDFVGEKDDDGNGDSDDHAVAAGADDDDDFVGEKDDDAREAS